MFRFFLIKWFPSQEFKFQNTLPEINLHGYYKQFITAIFANFIGTLGLENSTIDNAWKGTNKYHNPFHKLLPRLKLVRFRSKTKWLWQLQSFNSIYLFVTISIQSTMELVHDMPNGLGAPCNEEHFSTVWKRDCF